MSQLAGIKYSLALEPAVGSFPLCILEEPACIALGKLHSLRVTPEEGNGKQLLTTLYLQNPGKGCVKWN